MINIFVIMDIISIVFLRIEQFVPRNVHMAFILSVNLFVMYTETHEVVQGTCSLTIHFPKASVYRHRVNLSTLFIGFIVNTSTAVNAVDSSSTLVNS